MSAPEPVLTLSREGFSGQSYANFADFKISRYENSGVAARTQIDLGLTHGDGDFHRKVEIVIVVLSIRQVSQIGIEPMTPVLSGLCSNQLSYWLIVFEQAPYELSEKLQ